MGPPDWDEDVEVSAGAVRLAGQLAVPDQASGIVVFAHGSGSSRHSPRNRYAAAVLNQAGLGTLLFDLLTPDEEVYRANVFDIRQDGGDSPCPAPAAGMEQQEQLHEVIADRGPGGLDHIHVVAAQVTHDRAQLTVREPVQLARHRLAAQRLRDRTREQRVGGPWHDPKAHPCLTHDQSMADRRYGSHPSGHDERDAAVRPRCWLTGKADADVGGDGAVLADEYRVEVELCDLGDVFDHVADPVQQFGEGGHVQRRCLAVAGEQPVGAQ